MSRIGKTPILIPQGVDVKVLNNKILIKGSKGNLEFIFDSKIFIEINNGYININRKDDSKNSRSLHGTTRAIINNMLIGVNKFFEKELDMIGVGYKANISENKIIINAGYSHPVEIKIEKGLELELPKPTKIIVKGIDKQLVGAFASKIRSIRVPEPYKGKGIRYSNEYVRKKVGKTGSK